MEEKIYLTTSGGQLVLAESAEKARFILRVPEPDALFIYNAFKQYDLLQRFLAETLEDQRRKPEHASILVQG